MPTDGTLIRPFLGEALAQDGLGRRAAASPHPRGGRISQGTAQPVAIAPKCFPDAPRFWPLPLPSITDREGSVIREPWLRGSQDEQHRGRRGTQRLRGGEDKKRTSLVSPSLAFSGSVPLPPPAWAEERQSFNFMAAVTICSDFGAQKNKV